MWSLLSQRDPWLHLQDFCKCLDLDASRWTGLRRIWETWCFHLLQNGSLRFVETLDCCLRTKILRNILSLGCLRMNHKEFSKRFAQASLCYLNHWVSTPADTILTHLLHMLRDRLRFDRCLRVHNWSSFWRSRCILSLSYSSCFSEGCTLRWLGASPGEPDKSLRFYSQPEIRVDSPHSLS